MKIKIEELKELVNGALKKYGYLEEEIPIISKVMMYAQLRGNNQGVIKLIGKGVPKNLKCLKPKIIKETPVSGLVDGGGTYSMLVANQLVDIALEKAKKVGIGMVGNFNTAESSGALGYYADRIAKQGYIGIVYASLPLQLTAPYGSNQAVFCTNPLAYGIPTNNEPIVLDMSTSAISYFGLIEAKTAGKQVPEGIGFDAEGNPTTDPAKILSGAISTIAEYKGSGLALIVQILSSALVGADYFHTGSLNGGNLVMAIDPNIFRPTSQFKNSVSDMVSKVKSARKVDGISEILIPGERGNRLTNERVKSGEIEIEDNLLMELKKVSS